MLHYGWLMCTLGEICADVYLQFKYRPIGAAWPLKGLYFIICQKTFLRVANYKGDKWDVISAVK